MYNSKGQKDNILIDSSISITDDKIKKSLNGNENENLQKNINDTNSNSTPNNPKNKKTKRVKFVDKAIIIDVDCWKEYNYEQTTGENFEEYMEELQKNENNNNKNITKKIEIKKKEETDEKDGLSVFYDQTGNNYLFNLNK